MRIKFNTTGRGKCYYIIRSVYRNGKNTSEIVEKLGYEDEIREQHHCDEAIAWIKQHLKELNAKEEASRKVLVPFDAAALITPGEQQSFNIGYLFLQRIWYQLKLDLICSAVRKKYKLPFDLNGILSRCVFRQILFPSSALSTARFTKDFPEQTEFEYADVSRALPVLSREMDFIEKEVYRNIRRILTRPTSVLFHFSMPSSPVPMDLILDEDALPLAMDIHPENQKEPQTLTPWAEELLASLPISRCIDCTDADRTDTPDQKLHDSGGRFFVRRIPINGNIVIDRQWKEALDPEGWSVAIDGKVQTGIDIRHLADGDRKKNSDRVFYKAIPIEGDGTDQDSGENRLLVVTFSLKDQDEQRDGEDAADAELDGFHTVITNLPEDEMDTVLATLREGREISDFFGIRKQAFREGSAEVSQEERTKAHFLVCFLALLVLRILKKELGGNCTEEEITDTLRKMRVTRIKDVGYIPAYTRTKLTDRLHDLAGFRTDYEIIREKAMRGILRKSRQR